VKNRKKNGLFSVIYVNIRLFRAKNRVSGGGCRAHGQQPNRVLSGAFIAFAGGNARVPEKRKYAFADNLNFYFREEI